MASTRINSLPDSLYTADGVQALDRFLIEEKGVDGFGLMQQAARAAFRQLLRRWPEPGRIVVLCGAGNNGGDGYLVAVNALQHGLAAECLALSDPGRLSGDAGRACKAARDAGVPILRWADLPVAELDALFDRANLFVDALLGTGTRGAPRAPFDEAIGRVNRLGRPVLAVDIPSGLNGTTGHGEAEVVQATVTVTFIGMKTGLVTGKGPQFCGDLVFDDLGTADDLASGPVPKAAKLVDWGRASGHLPVRSRVAHKGAFGHVVIVAGDRGFGGAGLLAAEAASRSGAGLVTLVTRPEHVAPMLARCPSVMVRGITHGNELADLLKVADTVVCGPGIGQQAWGQQMLQQVLAADCPRVLDADALNLLSRRVPVANEHQLITPHPGEAARLLGTSVANIESDRLAAAEALCRRFGGVVLLKGAGTVIAARGQIPVIIAGANPGMATGGMGDVLSGICGALAGQLPDLVTAAMVAASAHLAAADLASESLGYMALLPTDLMAALPALYAGAEQLRADMPLRQERP